MGQRDLHLQLLSAAHRVFNSPYSSNKLPFPTFHVWSMSIVTFFNKLTQMWSQIQIKFPYISNIITVIILNCVCEGEREERDQEVPLQNLQ